MMDCGKWFRIESNLRDFLKFLTVFGLGFEIILLFCEERENLRRTNFFWVVLKCYHEAELSDYEYSSNAITILNSMTSQMEKQKYSFDYEITKFYLDVKMSILQMLSRG